MAVSRWFAGIGAKNNVWSSTTIVAEEGQDTWFIGFSAQTDATTKLTSFKIFATPTTSPNGEMLVYCHPAVSSVVEADAWKDKLHLRELTVIYPVIKTEAANTIVVAHGTFARLTHVEGNRRFNQVDRAVGMDNFVLLSVHMTTPDTNEWVLEHQASTTKLIVAPMHQSTPAVADQLNVSSTSADDTLLGTGAQKISFTYYDTNYALKGPVEVEMNGTTFVNIIATVADCWLVKVMWVSQHGSTGKNQGDIFLHDNI